MSGKRYPSWANTIGAGLAHVQHALDSAILWGFRRLRAAGAPKRKSNSATKVGKGLMFFLGEVGDSYFKTYGRLKSKR